MQIICIPDFRREFFTPSRHKNTNAEDRSLHLKSVSLLSLSMSCMSQYQLSNSSASAVDNHGYVDDDHTITLPTIKWRYPHNRTTSSNINHYNYAHASCKPDNRWLCIPLSCCIEKLIRVPIATWSQRLNPTAPTYFSIAIVVKQTRSWSHIDMDTNYSNRN